MALPDPQLGLVVSYAYLWHREHAQGQDTGRKDRPCVIILAADLEEDGTRVTVVPVTHSPPSDPLRSNCRPPSRDIWVWTMGVPG